MRRFAGRLAGMMLLACGGLGGAGTALAQGGFEPAPDVNLDRLLPSSVLQSSNHRVQAATALQHNSVQFRVRSEFGLYQVYSLPLFLTRIHEIRTLAQAIDAFQRNYQDLAVQLRGDLVVGGDSIAGILFRPISTTEELARQLGSNVGQTVDELRLGTTAADGAGDSVYESVVPADPVLAAHKRSVANQLALDAYSSNPAVQQFLNQVALARGRGDFQAANLGVTVARLPVRHVAGGRVHAQARSRVTRSTLAERAVRAHRREVDQHLVRTAAGGDAFLPEHHLPHGGRGGQAHHDDVGRLGDALGIFRSNGARLHQRRHLPGRPVPDGDIVAGVEQPPRHRPAHQAGADVAEGRFVVAHSSSLRIARLPILRYTPLRGALRMRTVENPKSSC